MLRDISKHYGTKYTDDEEKSWLDSLSSLDSNYTSVNDFYNNFNNQNQYTTWKNYGDWSGFIQNVVDKDPEAYHKYIELGKSISNPSWKETNPKLNILGWQPMGEPETVNNLVTFAEMNSGHDFAAALDDVFDIGNEYAEEVQLINMYMTEAEKARYNYYLGIGDTKMAEGYMDYMLGVLENRRAGEISDALNGVPVLEPLVNFSSGVIAGVQGIPNFVNSLTGKDPVELTALQGASQNMMADNKGVNKFINDALYSTGNMLPAMGLGPTAGSIYTGISSAGNAYAEKIAQGYGVDEARKYGLMTGIAEGGLNYAIGGISSIGGRLSGHVIKNAVDGIDNGIARFIVDISLNSTSEALEEGIQTALEPVFHSIATGEKYEPAKWSDITYSALLGAVTSGVLEGVPRTIGLTQNISNAKKRFVSNAGNITTQALELNPNSKIAKNAQSRIDSGKAVTGAQIYSMLQNIDRGYTKQDSAKIKSAVETRLTELGASGDVSNLANAIAKQTVGEELSSKESKLIKNSQYAKRVLNELNPKNIASGQYTSAWAEGIGTKKVNADVYNLRERVDTPTEQNATQDVSTPSGAVQNKPYESASTDLIEEAAQDKMSKVPGFTEEAANVMRNGYDGRMLPSEYIRIFDEAYNLGLNGAQATSVVNLAHDTEGINQSTLLAAYDLGRQAKEKSVSQTPTESDIINTESEALTNEGTSEGAGIHLRRGSEWNDGSYPQEQVSGLDSRPGTNQTRGEGSRPADGEAVNLVNEGREVRVAELGILNGSKTQTVRLVDANKETTAMKKARKDAESRGLKIKFFVGDNIAITEKTGEISAVRAYVLGDTMLVRADHPVYTADQLERHEAGHVRIERGEINLKDVRKRLEEIVGKEAVEGVAEAYADLYAGTGMTAEEIWEECICDFLGDINIFSKSANGSLVVNELINQTQAITKEQKAEPNQTRGSPDAEGKASREQVSKNTLNFAEDKYYQRQIDNIESLKDGAYISVGEVRENSPLNKVGFPNATVYFDVSKIIKEMKTRTDALPPEIMKKIPQVLNHPIVITEFIDKQGIRSANVYGHLYIGTSPVVIGIMMVQTQKGSIINKIQTVHPNRNVLKEMTDDKILYLSENKKETKLWFQSLGTQKLPLGGNKFGFIRMISQNNAIVNKSEIKFSRELDTEYLSAVNRGDMKTAQRMVDEAAKNAGYTYKGMHGTSADFSTFDYSYIGDDNKLGLGFYFTNNENLQFEYDYKKTAYLKISNPIFDNNPTLDDILRREEELREKGFSQEETLKAIQNEFGYDGIVAEYNRKALVAFNPEQIKSADPVTYDDDGNVIPLSERFNSESNDIRYSRELDVLDYITPEEELEAVKTQAFSNRTLLANALLDTITSSEEYKLVRSYQEEIAKLDAGDKRLAQLKKDLNQLYKQEKPNVEVIRELREKITALESEIVNRDKRLLRLESTTALKNVLERARKDAYAKAMQKGKETMHRAVESRHKTIERNKAKKTAHELEMLLNKNDKKRNVKLGEQAIVRAALDLSDMYFVTDDDLIMNGIQTPALDRENDALAQYRALYDRLHATDNDVTNHKEERAQLRHEMNEVKKVLRDLLERERKRINTTYASSVYDAVIKEYEKLKASPDTYVSRAFDEKVLVHLKKLKSDLGSKLVSEMTLDELKDVNKAFSMVKHMIVDSNKMFREGRTEDIQERVSRIFSDVSKVGSEKKDQAEIFKTLQKIEKLGWDNLRPVDVFELIDSAGLTDLFWDAVSAQDVYARDVVEYQNALEKARRKYGYKNWEFKPVTTFKTADGKELKLTLGEMMSIYAYSKRAQADEHLRKGGIQFKKQAIYKDNKGVTRIRSGKEYTYHIDDALRLNIISKLTQEQRAYVEEMQKILTDWGQKGNEVTRVLYGIDLFNEENYFPLRSSHDYLPSANTQLGQTVTTASLVGSAFAKSTVPHANNPIILDSFDAVVHDHIDRMSKYHAYVIPIENLRKILDAQITDSSGQIISLKSKIGSRLGDGAVKYLEQYITDLNGGVQQGYDNGLMGFFGKAKGAMVAANLSVWVQQYFSVIRAMNEINPTYFAPFMGESYKQPDMKLYEEMKKYAPITVIKEMGGFDVGARGSVEQYVGFNEAGRSREKVSQKMQDAFGVGANVMDKLGWMTIWKAVKKEVAETNQYKLGSEEFYKACGKRMNEVITKTQVYDSVNARSGNMRKKSDWWKMATSFLGEPTTIAGMATVDFIKLKRAIASGNKEAIGAAIGKYAGTMVTISISTAMTSIFKSLIYAMRDDDEDENYAEKYATALAGAFRDDINPLGYYPILRDLKSIWQGYTIERPDMQLFEDAINSYKKLFIDKDEEEPSEQTFEEAINFMGSIANIFSIPMKNIVRDLRGLYNTVTNIGNGYKTNLKDAIKEGYDRKENTKSYNIYVAELRGDTNRINYYKSSYEDNSKYYSDLRKAIRDYDPRVETAANARLEGDNDTYYNLMYDLIEEGHFDSDLIKEAFEAEYKYLKKKKEEAEDEE